MRAIEQVGAIVHDDRGVEARNARSETPFSSWNSNVVVNKGDRLFFDSHRGAEGAGENVHCGSSACAACGTTKSGISVRLPICIPTVSAPGRSQPVITKLIIAGNHPLDEPKCQKCIK